MPARSDRICRGSRIMHACQWHTPNARRETGSSGRPFGGKSASSKCVIAQPTRSGSTKVGSKCRPGNPTCSRAAWTVPNGCRPHMVARTCVHARLPLVGQPSSTDARTRLHSSRTPRSSSQLAMYARSSLEPCVFTMPPTSTSWRSEPPSFAHSSFESTVSSGGATNRSVPNTVARARRRSSVRLNPASFGGLRDGCSRTSRRACTTHGPTNLVQRGRGHHSTSILGLTRLLCTSGR